MQYNNPPRGRGRGRGRGGGPRYNNNNSSYGTGSGTGGRGGGGGYRGYQGSLPRYNRYSNQYRESGAGHEEDRSTNHRDFRERQTTPREEYAYNQSRSEIQETRDGGGGYQQQSHHDQQNRQQQGYQDSAQSYNAPPTPPPQQYWTDRGSTSDYGQERGRYNSDCVIPHAYTNHYEWDQESWNQAAGPFVYDDYGRHSSSQHHPQTNYNDAAYTSAPNYVQYSPPDSMSRSGEDSRSSLQSHGGYGSNGYEDQGQQYANRNSPESGSDDVRYAPAAQYRNPALDFENVPYVPPGGYTHQGDSHYRHNPDASHGNWNYRPNDSYNNSYSNQNDASYNSGNNGPETRQEYSSHTIRPDYSNQTIRPDYSNQTIRPDYSNQTMKPEHSNHTNRTEYSNPREVFGHRDSTVSQSTVTHTVTSDSRREFAKREPRKEMLQKRPQGTMEISGRQITVAELRRWKEELKSETIGEKKRMVYDDWGEIKGTLVFERGGGGVNVYQSCPDDVDEEGNHIPPTVHNPFRAPRGWVPTESKVEKLFQNDQQNVANLQIVQESACIVVGETTATPFDSWSDSGLHDHLVRVLVEKCGFQKPRPIQISAVSEIMSGKNIVAQSVTGSGKTLAFVLPIIDKLMKMSKEQRQNSCRKPLAIVVQPTRELAQQVYDAFRRVTDGTDIRCVRAIGQMDKWKIVQELFKGVDVYIGTVGRLMDLVDHREVYLERLEFFVIDEADRFLNAKDMEHLRGVVKSEEFKKTDHKRQTLVFSATMTAECVQIAQSIMKKDYVLIKNNDSKANRLVKQVYLEAKGKQAKNVLLKRLFDQDKKDGVVVKTLIFVDTKKQSDFLALELINMHYSAHSINGDRPQNIRDEIYHKFLDGQISILVGTDVCSRGWDIPNLQRVINYDLPQLNDNETMENIVDKFVHRIGRTGRIREGTAITFVDPWLDKGISTDLVEICREVGQEPPNFLLELAGEAIVIDAFAPPVGFVEGEAPNWSEHMGSPQKKWEEVVRVEETETPILDGGSSEEEEEETQEDSDDERGGARRRLNTVEEEDSESDDVEEGEESDGEDDVIDEPDDQPAVRSDVTESAIAKD